MRATRRRPRSTPRRAGPRRSRWTIATRSTPNRAAISSAIVAERGERHRLERLVFERVHGPAGVPRGLGLLARRGRPGRGPRPPEEPDHGAVLGERQLVRELGEDGRRERRLAELDDPARVAGAPPDTGGIIATSSPSASTVVGVGVLAVPREAHRRPPGREDREAAPRAPPRPPRRPTPSASSSVTSRVPASSRWTANSRTRTRMRHGRPRRSRSTAPRGDEQAVADRQDRGREARVGEDRGVEGAQRRGVRVTRLDRPGARDATAPQDVVGGDERARREPPDERLEVRLVFGLERVDEDEVERAVELRVVGGRREGLERGRVDDRDPLVRRCRPGATSRGRGRSARGPGRSSRSCRRPAGRAPATASSSRRRCRPRRSAAGRRPARTAPARRRGRRSGCRAARRRPRSRRGPAAAAAPAIRSSRDRRRPGSRSGRSCSSRPPRREGRRRNRGRRRGSSRPRSSPTLIYSNPVADSIDRVRAVWTDAQQTMSGKISPTISRSQTNSAHGPTSDENGATSAGPAPVAVHATNSTTWSATTASRTRASRMSGASGQLRRDEVPVAEDHRREHAADGRADDRELDEQGDRAERPVAPGQRPEHERRDRGGDRTRSRRATPRHRPRPTERRSRARRAPRTARAPHDAARPRPGRRRPASPPGSPAARRPRSRRGPRSRARTAPRSAGSRASRSSGGGAARSPRTSRAPDRSARSS